VQPHNAICSTATSPPRDQRLPALHDLPSGSNSACCNLGKNPPDICLGGGLCQRMDSTEGNFDLRRRLHRSQREGYCLPVVFSECISRPRAGNSCHKGSR
jgi:hypothetical protein